LESPSWTFELGNDSKMVETLGAITEQSAAILLGPPDPRDGRPRLATAPPRTTRAHRSFNDTEKLVVGAQPPGQQWASSTPIGASTP